MHLHRNIFTFRNFENESSKILNTPYTENEWQNFNKYVVIMEEEEERDENNIKEFIILI